jgi:hypothetical protein
MQSEMPIQSVLDGTGELGVPSRLVMMAVGQRIRVGFFGAGFLGGAIVGGTVSILLNRSRRHGALPRPRLQATSRC